MKKQSNTIYVDAMIKSLHEKKELLEEILQLNTEQKKLLQTVGFSLDTLEALSSNKQLLIEEVERLDMAFESNYSRVKDELCEKKELYRIEIKEMQGLIKGLAGMIMEIRCSEEMLKQQIQMDFSTLRQKVKQFNTNSKTASQYYKTMSNTHQGQAYFLDQKK